MKNVYKIVKYFPYPGARYENLGPYSGESFKKYLYKIIIDNYGTDFKNNSSNEVIIDLDGTPGYGSSFLEEGFGGLIRLGVPYTIVNSLIIKTEEEPELAVEIKDYINDEYKKIKGK
ncbi:STAS-like domain-containing protein [Proteus faecis]|uniref:STAS-like domain-containing protein n=1 Tax=Proteus faecis TaxID=2050967 RepID=UPI003CE9A69F